MDQLKPCEVWEVMTCFNQRSSLGRVVVNPPGRMAPLVPHKTGEAWYICKTCGFACLSAEKMLVHKEKHMKAVNEESLASRDDAVSEGPSVASNDMVNENNGNESDEDVDMLEFKDDIINKNKDHFECHICHKHLVTLKGLRNHHLVHQDKRREKCKVCGATFKKKQYLAKHAKRSHNESFTNACKICTCSFETERGLKIHMQFYHDISLADSESIGTSKASEICLSESNNAAVKRQRKVSNPQAIKRSSPSSSKENSPKPLLKTKTKSITSVARSVVLKAIKHTSKSSSTQFECKICRRKVTSKSVLKRHIMNVHNNGAMEVKCKLCGNWFKDGTMKKHIQCTHGDGTFKCYYCPCKLVNKGVRRRHCSTYHPNELNPDLDNKRKTKLKGV